VKIVAAKRFTQLKIHQNAFAAGQTLLDELNAPPGP